MEYYEMIENYENLNFLLIQLIISKISVDLTSLSSIILYNIEYSLFRSVCGLAYVSL